MSAHGTIEAREKVYGNYRDLSCVSQDIKRAIISNSDWYNLKPYQRESLEMIAVKIARILNGDPNHADNWHDIAGYAQLVEQQLEKTQD